MILVTIVDHYLIFAMLFMQQRGQVWRKEASIYSIESISKLGAKQNEKKIPLFVISLFAFCLFASTAPALTVLGNQITIYDQKSNGSNNHGSSEDQEVEPGMQWHQKCDLERLNV